jgi:hypothetical protein
MPQEHFAAIIIGTTSDPRRAPTEQALNDRTASLSDSNEQLQVVDQNGLGGVPEEARAIAIVLCRAAPGYDHAELEAIEECKRRKIPIIPVVESLTKFVEIAPKGVGEFNGFQLVDNLDAGELAGLMLEAIGLQRAKRKVFISYARMDSSYVAEQLRQAFMARWYSVFLDTISIRPGAFFQDELMQELADSDAVIFLNSPNARERPYVKDEIAFADKAGVSGVQVVWPTVGALREGTFFLPIKLDNRLAKISGKEGDTVEALEPAGIEEILRKVADQRTEMQRIRERELLQPIAAYAKTKSWNAVPYLGRHIELNNGTDTIHLDIALGVPTSFDLERAFVSRREEGEAGKLVYDPLGTTNRQARHLDFLRSQLKLEYLDPRKTLSWTVIR